MHTIGSIVAYNECRNKYRVLKKVVSFNYSTSSNLNWYSDDLARSSTMYKRVIIGRRPISFRNCDVEQFRKFSWTKNDPFVHLLQTSKVTCYGEFSINILMEQSYQ